jgi:hypothetical protein
MSNEAHVKAITEHRKKAKETLPDKGWSVGVFGCTHPSIDANFTDWQALAIQAMWDKQKEQQNQ